MSGVTDFVGLPYRDGGRGPDAFDCWGLAREVLASVFGVDLPAYPYGETRESRSQAVTAALPDFECIPEPRPGALALFVTGRSRPHVGVCVEGNRMIHADRRNGVVIERLDGLRWRNNCEGYYVPHRC